MPLPLLLSVALLLSLVSIIRAAVAVASAPPSLMFAGEVLSLLVNDICGRGRRCGLAPERLMLIAVEFVPVLARSGEKCIALNAGLSSVGVGGMSGEGFVELLAVDGFLYCQSVAESVVMCFVSIASSSSLSSTSRTPFSPFNCLTHLSRYRTYSMPACKIASLCISMLSQAGIMSFSTPNSSFILLLRRRSMMLWAVFLATLRPAALVADGGLRLLLVALCGLGGGCDASKEDEFDDLGFTWIILRARLGGGGKL